MYETKVVGKGKTSFVFSKVFFFLDLAVYEIMQKKIF